MDGAASSAPGLEGSVHPLRVTVGAVAVAEVDGERRRSDLELQVRTGRAWARACGLEAGFVEGAASLVRQGHAGRYG
jgi:hypothetical protein